MTKQYDENDDPSPNDLTQWISTNTSLQPNFEFSYPNTWKLDCMQSGTLKLISPTEISPWTNQEDVDNNVMDQIRVDFTQIHSTHEEIHQETFKKLMSSYAISDYCEIQVLKEFDLVDHHEASSKHLHARKSLIQYTSYGRIQMTRHYVITVSLESCTYIFTYLTESVGGEKNLMVFYKFLQHFKFPSSGSTFIYELQMNQQNSILFDIPFPYQVVQKREASLTTYTPSHAKYSTTEPMMKQLFFDFQVFKTNVDIETVANEALKRTEVDVNPKEYTFTILPKVSRTDDSFLPNSFTFSYEYQHREIKEDRKFVEKYFTPLVTGDVLNATFVNSISKDIQDEELKVFRTIVPTFKLIERKERRQYASKIVNNYNLQYLGQQLSEFNVAVYGELGVGKSTLIHQYLTDGDCADSVQSNKKDHSYRKYVPKSESHSAFVLNILDTCGSYESENAGQYEKVTRADAVILICSTDQASSIERIETFIHRIETLKKRKVSEIPSLIVFNKTDIEDGAVKSEDAKKLADQFGITFVECTSKKQSKVNDVFDGALIAELYSKQYILNSMQSDQKKLSEDIEQFQTLISQNQVDQISSLISESVFPPSLVSEYLNLPIIFYAVENGVEDATLRLLLDYNDKNEKYNFKNFTTKDNNAMNLATYAASKGNLAAVKVLEERGITIDQTRNDSNILAHILNGSDPENEIVQYLLAKYDNFLSKYVNVSFKDDENGTIYPIHIATKSGSFFAIKWLIAHGATQSINEKDSLGLTPLLLAAAEGNTALVQLLQDSGAKLTSNDATFKEFLKENCPEDKLTEVLSLIEK